jgi:hypothetical protein
MKLLRIFSNIGSDFDILRASSLMKSGNRWVFFLDKNRQTTGFLWLRHASYGFQAFSSLDIYQVLRWESVWLGYASYQVNSASRIF